MFVCISCRTEVNCWLSSLCVVSDV